VVTLKINGKSHTVDASPDMPLLWVLRDLLGMNGTKSGCDVALCGACAAHLEGNPTDEGPGAQRLTAYAGIPAPVALGHEVSSVTLGHEVFSFWRCKS
jgi:Aerobic-type carbon monoxide dehydrogenase, small subunit CoxS/CutS homologs